MNNGNHNKPVVLVLAGHDPSGGAGIQADIETITNSGCHAATVITSLTTQDTKKVTNTIAQNPDDFKEQIEIIFSDMEIRACKLGIFTNSKLIEIAHDLLKEKNIPIVLDPVIASGSGKVFSDDIICQQIISLLIPLADLVSPNSLEARILSDKEELDMAAETLLRLGAGNILITGTHEETEFVINKFYTSNSQMEYSWPRLNSEFHGSGCTLSSRIAARLALGENIGTAIEEAQEYTWNTLKNYLDVGKGQKLPNRMFNINKN